MLVYNKNSKLIVTIIPYKEGMEIDGFNDYYWWIIDKKENVMSMISPESFASEYENESNEKLLKIRDELIDEIRYFENNKDTIMQSDIMQQHPQPDIVYQIKLEYLAAVCSLISQKFNEQIG